MNVSQTEQPILAKPHVNYLGGITSAYETNKVSGGNAPLDDTIYERVVEQYINTIGHVKCAVVNNDTLFYHTKYKYLLSNYNLDMSYYFAIVSIAKYAIHSFDANASRTL